MSFSSGLVESVLMEKQYVVSHKPGGCLLCVAFSGIGVVIGGLLAHRLFVAGLDGRLAAVVFLSTVLISQVPVIIRQCRRPNTVSTNDSRSKNI
jgi:hypothetical protein